MRGKKAKRLRRESKGLPKPKQFFKALTTEIEGSEVFYPRAQRRAIMRKFHKELKAGRIDLKQLEEERKKRDDRTAQRQGV